MAFTAMILKLRVEVRLAVGISGLRSVKIAMRLKQGRLVAVRLEDIDVVTI